MASAPPPAHPAATVVLLRDGSCTCEVLLVRRNSQLSFHGGAWVFPGGRIDPEDYASLSNADVAAAARVAAVREAREEAGVTVAPDALVLFSRWVTPVNIPKRFDTWFFAAATTGAEVHIDGGEIHDHRWMAPADALAAHCRGEIELPPPTYVTLRQLGSAEHTAGILEGLRVRRFEFFEPHLHLLPDGACTLYHGDVAYGSGALDQPGPRHRLWIRESGWQYERTEESA